jgi:hypothetical protein
MLRVPLKYIDSVNIACIALTCMLAHIFPYHLLIFSYTVLGPAHYLTQISWMHDRRYFANSSLLVPAMGVLAFLCILLIDHDPQSIEMPEALALCVAVGLAIFWIMPEGHIFFRGLGATAGVSVCLLAAYSPNTALFISILLPTVLHVFVFTAAFMWVGATKSRKISAYAAVFILLACAATFLIPSANPETAPNLVGLAFFKPVVLYMQKMLGLPAALETQLFGFLSFAYTYHYLNWFSKAEVIHWDRIPRKRMMSIVAIYVLALAVYAYDYTIGFLFITLLSVLHVLLEFPLDLRTFAAIIRGMRPAPQP